MYLRLQMCYILFQQLSFCYFIFAIMSEWLNGLNQDIAFIKQVMKATGITHAELSGRLGWSRSKLTAFLQPKDKVTIENISKKGKIVDALDSLIADLVEEEAIPYDVALDFFSNQLPLPPGYDVQRKLKMKTSVGSEEKLFFTHMERMFLNRIIFDTVDFIQSRPDRFDDTGIAHKNFFIRAHRNLYRHLFAEWLLKKG